MTGDLVRLADRASRGAPAAARKDALNAAAALVAHPSPAALVDWMSALSNLPGGAEASLLRAWGLPLVPGLDSFVGPVVDRLLRGDPSLADGATFDLPLGPLHLGTTLPAVVLHAADGSLLLAGLDMPSEGTASVAAGPVAVSGALAHTENRYAGSLVADLGAVRAAALAVLSGGPGPSSFVAVLGARFTPGIQVGFGFEISAVGGVVGVNVATSVDDLRASLSSGAATALFFPTGSGGPEANARLALAPQVFPPHAGSVVAGPAAEVTWLQVAGYSLLRLSAVALVELPLARLVVLGRAAVFLPPVLDLELAVMGELDPAAGLLGVDLAVVSGRLFGLLRVDGTAALRLRTTSPACSVFTLGGFYPGYRADVPGLPPQRRLSMGADVALPLTFRYEGYFAVTDGSFQAGARVEIAFDLGLSVHGFLQFDAIAAYDPFHVHADLVGGVSVGAWGMEFGGVDFYGQIDGPGPVVISGRVSVSFLGAEAGWDGSFRLGDSQPTVASPPVRDLLGLVVLGAERGTPEDEPLTIPASSLVATDGADHWVAVDAPSIDDGLAVLPATGGARWSQTVAPFDTPVQRVRGRLLAAATKLELNHLPADVAAGPVEQFAPAALHDADRDQLLTLPGYERLPSGVEVRLEPTPVGTGVGATLEYRELYRVEPPDWRDAGAFLTPFSLSRLVQDRLAAPVARRRAPTVSVGPDEWRVGIIKATSRTAAVLMAASRGTGAVPVDEPTVAASTLWGA